MFFLLMLVLLGTFLMFKRGRLGPPAWITQHRSPESEAKRILAERFANSDISSEEFMERASILNWTPGSEEWPQQTAGKKRKRQR